MSALQTYCLSCCFYLLQVQTNGECEPKAAMQDALQDLSNEFGELATSFAVSADSPPLLYYIERIAQ